MDQIESAFAKAGFKVARNTPFAGAYVTQTYGRPQRNQHAVQVEIDRSLYMDEATVTPSASFERVKTALTGVLLDICEIGRDVSLPVAAE